MKTLTVTNGVDVQALFETIQAIRNDPELADFRFRLKNEWRNGGLNTATIEGFYGCKQEMEHTAPFSLDADEPAVLLSEDRGPNPVEYAITALAACLTTSMVYHAAARGIEIEALESTVEGDIDLRGFLGISDDVRRGYQNIRVNFRVKADAPAETLRELALFSPVADTIANPVPVDVQVEKV